MKYIITLLCLHLLPGYSYAQVNIPFGKDHRIVYHLKEGTYTVILNGQTVFENVYAAAPHIDSRATVKRSYFKKKIGRSTVYTFTSGPLQQLFYTFPDKDYCIIVLKLEGIPCNFLSHFNSTKISAAGRIVNFPFVNDM